MITQEQIEQWIHEVEERPSSAPIILQFVSQRLFDLVRRNEELLDENILLKTGKKVEEYENKINSLEFQLAILKRQLGSDSFQLDKPNNNSLSLLLFNYLGKIIRADIRPDIISESVPTFIYQDYVGNVHPRLFVTNPEEELLFAFDSGRTESQPVSQIQDQLNPLLKWENSWALEPRGAEELSAIIPIGKMALFDGCIQVSRRGCARNILISSLENHISKNFIGTGINQRPDRTCILFFANKNDQFILASREGYLVTIRVSQLGFSAEETVRLNTTDHIVTAFVQGRKKFIIVVTDTGKIIHREMSWLEPVETFRSKGQPIFSQSRREAGVRCAGAAAVNEDDWGIILLSNGEVRFSKIIDLITTGIIEGIPEETTVVDFVTIQLK